jgi:two-component system, cell cycle response regulator CtrA
MHALLIADDAAWARSIESMLEESGVSVHIADRGADDVCGKIPACDVIVLDLPNLSGADVVRGLRDAGVKTPVVILCSNAGIEDAFRSLGFDAVECVVKPFYRWHFTACVHAAIRRAQGHADTVITTGDLAINLDRKSVDVAGTCVSLTSREYKTLEQLALAQGAILSRQTLRDHLYGGVDEPDLKMIELFILTLRKKLSDAANKSGRERKPYVEIVADGGYRLPKAS